MIDISGEGENLGEVNQSLGSVWDNGTQLFMQQQLDRQHQQDMDMGKQFQEQMNNVMQNQQENSKDKNVQVDFSNMSAGKEH